MNESKITEIKDIGEFGLITELTDFARNKNDSTKKGIGDDAAIIEYKDVQTVLSTDLLMEGVHFDLIYTPLMHLGYKAVIVNLSDIIAMNAQPHQITFSIAISSKFSVESIKEIYKGIEKACNYYEVDLIGGDTTASLTGLAISVTAIGSAKESELVYRNGAKVGDYICVSGNLGASYLGLQIMEREKQIYLENKNIQPELSKHKYLVERFLKPEARKDIIDLLGVQGIKPNSMIDISDGLSSELLHICTQSQVGCNIFDENIPIHQETINTGIQFNIDPTVCALNGGEDYELLFTIDQKDFNKISEINDVNVIGRIVEKSEGLHLISKNGNKHKLKAQGWQAFGVED